MVKGYYLILLTVLLCTLSACGAVETELRIHMPRHSAVDSEAIQSIFEQQTSLQLLSADLAEHKSGLEALVSGEADIALVENSSAFEPGVRVILPAHKSVLHVLIRQDIDLADFSQPLKNHTAFVSNYSPAGRLFVETAAKRQRLSADELEIVDELQVGKTDLIIYFGPVNSNNPAWYVPGYRLLSLNVDDPQRALSTQAISYMLPHVETELIPAHTYDLPGNEQDIHTLSVDTLLATRKDVSEATIYRVTKTLLQQKPRFAAIAPETFSGVTEDFDKFSLSFPLHNGARRYLNRDEPGLLERYAETINMLVYLLFVVLTGAVAFARVHSQRKKDRIDEFYSRIMSIRQRATSEAHEPLLRELQALETEAFESLIAEKLAADESFRIFIELLTRAINELDVEPSPIPPD